MDVIPFQFELIPAKAGVPLSGLTYREPKDWRWMSYQELHAWQSTALASYVTRPYYRHEGTLEQVFTPVDADLSTATALMIRHIPFPYDFLPYPRSWGRTARGLVMALNARLPVLVRNMRSIGTAAIIDTGRPLPGIDLLPEPMRWQNPVTADRRRILPWLRTTYGRERNLPSGTPLKPVLVSEPDRSYFAPLATDPVAAAAVLTTELLEITRDVRVAWWSEGTMLFVWRHEYMPLGARPRLAEHARRIHEAIVANLG